jgi:hypothetical protein
LATEHLERVAASGAELFAAPPDVRRYTLLARAAPGRHQRQLPRRLGQDGGGYRHPGHRTEAQWHRQPDLHVLHQRLLRQSWASTRPIVPSSPRATSSCTRPRQSPSTRRSTAPSR